ncbi:MAG: maleylacetoacetate isomerase [Pseudomonadota bacterium]|nr:maleylacetoacetate isomerase [Pseudomonadota bacterium]
MKLYTYFASSGAYRVRIALALKGLKADMEFVNLTKGEQQSSAYAAINPQRLVPSFIDDGNVLTQSLAIIEYLEEKYPAPPLLPLTPVERARARAIAHAMASDIGPLNNLKIRKYIKTTLRIDEREWIQHWTQDGLTGVEAMLAKSPETGRFCHGAFPTLADCVLVPQLYHARRFGCNLSAFPTLTRIEATCNELPAFQQAHPANQPDATEQANGAQGRAGNSRISPRKS